MANYLKSDYQLNYSRYKHYYRQIWKFYQKPAIKISSALLLTVFTTIFFAIFAIRPTLVTVAELLKTIEDQEEVLSKLKSKAASLASAQEEYSFNQSTIEKLDTAIPNDQQIQEINSLVEATAADFELVIDNFSIGEFEYRNRKAQPEHVIIPLVITVNSDYPNLKEFMHALVRLPRFISIDSISFAEPEQSSTQRTQEEEIRLAIRFGAHYMPLQSQESDAK